jgi:hypothetical protein
MRVSKGLLLRGGVHDHTSQFFLGDQLEGDGHLNGGVMSMSSPKTSDTKVSKLYLLIDAEAT